MIEERAEFKNFCNTSVRPLLFWMFIVGLTAMAINHFFNPVTPENGLAPLLPRSLVYDDRTASIITLFACGLVTYIKVKFKLNFSDIMLKFKQKFFRHH